MLGVVADGGEVAGVEERAVVGELGALVAVLEAAAGVADVEGEVELVARRERRVELVDGVERARAGGHDVEGAVEAYIRDGLLLVGDVDLADGLRGLVLKHEVAGAGEGAALGENVDVGVDGDDLGLGEVLVLLEITLVVGLDVAAILGGEVLVQDVGVVEVPGAAADGDRAGRAPRPGSRRGARCAARRMRARQASSAPRRASAMESVASKQEMESQ